MKQKITPYIYISIFICFFNYSYGQKIALKISATDSTSTILLKSIGYQRNHFTEISLFKSLDSIKKKIAQIGFINFELDSVKKNDTLYQVHFDLKNKINIIKVYFKNGDNSKKDYFNSKIALYDKYFEVSPKNLPAALNEIATIYENKGVSFAEVSLHNILVKSDTIIAQLFIQQYKPRTIDKIIIKGYSDFPKTYVKNDLRLKTNSVFTKSKLDEASNTINNLPFAAELKTPEVLFTKDSTIVYLYLKKKLSNKFDGLIGFTSKEDGKGLQFSGYLDLSLNNIFNSGENFSLIWKNNGNDRQIFDLGGSLPYIFKSNFSPNVSINIYKQDSSFVNTKINFSLPYKLNSRNSIGLSLHSESSSILLSNSNNNIIDYNNLFYGLNYNYYKPNKHPIFPEKISIYIEALTGRRKNTLNNVNQNKLLLQTNFLWSLDLKHNVFIQNQSGTITSKNLYKNELFRLGGNNTIRGFNEESLTASTYSLFNIEYRFNTNNLSYLYSITDLGYIEDQNTNISSKLYALGLGYAFKSKIGMLNLSYALGGSPDVALNFNNSLFHFNIINVF